MLPSGSTPNANVKYCLLAAWQEFISFSRSELKLRGENFNGFAFGMVAFVGSKPK